MSDIDSVYIFPSAVWGTNIKENLEKKGTNLEDITEACLKWEKEKPRRHRSNKGPLGFQSGDIIYDPAKNDPLNRLINEIHFAVEAIHQTHRHGTVAFLNAWINISRKGSRNVNHCHPGSIYSGVVYIQFPEDSGNLIFHRDNMFKYSQGPETCGGFKDVAPLYAETYKVAKPEEGRVYIFPSYLEHSVEENTTDDTRISIAFNFSPINAWPEEADPYKV